MRVESAAEVCRQNVERKAASEIIMEQINANRQLTTFLEGLPLSPLGLRKKTTAEELGTPFTLWFSFSAFVSYIKSPEQAFASLLQDTRLDPEAKVIVWAMQNMRKQKKAADKAKYK